MGKGIGQEVTRLLLKYAFEELNLHRVDLRVLAYNVRAINCYKKCGFIIEGTERESAYVDGAWYDDLIIGILAHEFIARYS
jgi:RimJ/RimL family protein N-acetyltransferase